MSKLLRDLCADYEKAIDQRDRMIDDVLPLLRAIHYLVERSPTRGPGMGKVIVRFRELSHEWRDRADLRGADDDLQKKLEEARAR